MLNVQPEAIWTLEKLQRDQLFPELCRACPILVLIRKK